MNVRKVSQIVLFWLTLVSFGCSSKVETKVDRAKFKRGQKVYVVDGIFKGHEAQIGLYVGNGFYQLNFIKPNPGETSMLGTLRESEIVDTALVNTVTGEVEWSDE